MNHPYIATWEITKKCNLNCIHCYNNSSMYSDYGLKTEDCYKIIDRLDGIKNIIFTGGEAIIRKDIKEITSYARNKFDNLILQTNGKLIAKISDNFLQKFDEIDISIYGNMKTDKMFKKTNDTGLKGFLKKMKKLGLEFTVATVLTSINANQMEYLADFSLDKGAVGLRIQDFVPVGRGLSSLSIDASKSNTIKSNLKKKYKDFVLISSDYECGGGDKFIEIDCRGNTSPCAFIESNESILEKNLKEVINNSPIFVQFDKVKNERKKANQQLCVIKSM